MSQTDPAPAAPTSYLRGALPADIERNLRVVDAKTGETIPQVIEADAKAGTLSRFELDAAGDLVREGDRHKVVEEKRKIRIEWIDQPAAPETVPVPTELPPETVA